MIKCIFEDGGKGLLRHCVVNGLLIKDNKILLTRRAKHMVSPNKLCLVGGFVNRDETLIEAMLRETYEETGYEGKIVRLLDVVDNPNRKNEDRQNVAFVYLLAPVKKTGKPDNESSEIKWFDLDKLPDEEEFAFDHFEMIKRYLNAIKI